MGNETTQKGSGLGEEIGLPARRMSLWNRMPGYTCFKGGRCQNLVSCSYIMPRSLGFIFFSLSLVLR